MDYSALAQLLLERILLNDFPFLSHRAGSFLVDGMDPLRRLKLPASGVALDGFFQVEDTSTLTWRDIHKSSMKHYLLNQFGATNHERLELQLMYARKLITKDKVEICPRSFRITAIELP